MSIISPLAGAIAHIIQLAINGIKKIHIARQYSDIGIILFNVIELGYSVGDDLEAILHQLCLVLLVGGIGGKCNIIRKTQYLPVALGKWQLKLVAGVTLLVLHLGQVIDLEGKCNRDVVVQVDKLIIDIIIGGGSCGFYWFTGH